MKKSLLLLSLLFMLVVMSCESSNIDDEINVVINGADKEEIQTEEDRN
ncbi:hypothetical protein ACSTS3_07975 [Aquimarina muelleri]